MDVDDEGYVDRNEKINKTYDDSSERETIERLQKIYPKKSHEDIRDALRRAGTAVGALSLLSKSDDNQKYKRVKINKIDDEDEEDEEDERNRKRLSEAQRDRLVLKYFNTCTSKDLQDVTGCKPEQADKVVEELRPFSDMEDLEDKLKRTKGTSAKYINSCQEMMDGYTAVDYIIEKIESVGSNLRKVLDVWEDHSKHEKADGLHMTKVERNMDKHKLSSAEQDALEGYLTKQPDCVPKNLTLKDYQIMGVNWMLLLYRKGISGILADEMGLGKTAQVITFLGRLNELGETGPHLVIVPSSTIENWIREFERFCPNLVVRLYHGSVNERAEQRMYLKEERKEHGFQVIITTYQLAAGNADDRVFLKKLRCRSMILDEGHMVKNCYSARYKALMSISTPFRLLLTGTPLQNNLQELVSLLTFIMPNTFSNFEEEVRSIFKIRNTGANNDSKKNEGKSNVSTVQMLSKERILRAKKMMTPFVLRRRKENVLKDLPEKIQKIEYCVMTQRQEEIYSDIIIKSKKTYQESLEQKDKQPVKSKSPMNEQYESMRNIVVHLRKAVDHPLMFRNIYTDDMLKAMAKKLRSDVKYWDSVEELIYEDMTVMSDFELNNLCKEEKAIKEYQLSNEEWMNAGKIDQLKVLLPRFRKQGNKVLIFSQFTRMLDILELVMETMNVSYLRLDGETKVMERQNLIDEFNENEDIQVFLLSTKAGGFGINLTSANIVILYDLDFNPQNDKQAEDRAHRVGQTKDVTIYKLITKDSIEEHILRMANMKLRLDKNVSSNEDEEVVDDLEDTESQKQSLQSMIKEAFILADRRNKQH
ncbi:SNF2 family N-terminal domain-containing protein [Gilbertella persicaria]|uniref:SNF2 family N-terminal domain-containing protein n=1 Tax=Gilbertella persicaria TaxID=101096 RepID=UPI00222003AB|nr:SNF2 family N-terminal domain-containing protein [Gilbertella persicaria]KAI8050171.1 SNF2 family N-terminal domain-containing protein [Gilbertella persicaria]